MPELHHGGSIPLETERLCLRRYRPDDAQAIFANWASDPEVAKYLSWRAHANPKITQDVLDSWCRHETPETYRWTITLKPSAFPDAVPDQPVGQIDIVRRDADGWGELGWVLSCRYWGQGILPEAARAVFRYLMETVGFSGLRALHDVRNAASGRVMQKLGMRCIGTGEGRCTDNLGNPCTVTEYRLSREEFERLTIRPAQREDIAVIGALYGAVCDAQPKLPGKKDAPGWIREVYPVEATAREAFERNELYIALRAGRILGVVTLNESQPDAYADADWFYPADRALVVHTLAVHPEARGEGVAKALLVFAEDLARERDIPVIRLDTYELNFPAKRLYERLQYRRAKDIDLGIEETFGISNFHTYEKQIGK